MKEEKKGSKPDIQNNKISGIVLTLLFAITAILIVVILCVSFFGFNISTTNRNITELDRDWSIQEGVSSRRTNLPDEVDLSRSGVVSLSRTLPENVINGDTLMLLSEHQNIEVYMDDFLIYSFESTGVLSSFGGKQYCFVPLTSDMAGKRIEVKYLIEGGVKQTYISLPVMGGAEAIVSYLFQKNFFVLTFGGFFVIAGGVLILSGMARYFSKNAGLSVQIMLAGLFIFTLALKQLLGTGMLQLLGQNESFMYLLNYCCKLLMPVPVLWYFIIALNYRYRILDYICQLGLLNTVVTIVIFMTGIVDIYRFETSIQIMVIVAGVTLLYALMVERIKIGSFKYTLPIFTAFALTLSGMLEMIRGLSGGAVGSGLSDIAYLITAALMLAVVVCDMKKTQPMRK